MGTSSETEDLQLVRNGGTTAAIIRRLYGQYPPPGFPSDVRHDEIPIMVHSPLFMSHAGSVRHTEASREHASVERRDIKLSPHPDPIHKRLDALYHEAGHALAFQGPALESKQRDEKHAFCLHDVPFLNRLLNRHVRSWPSPFYYTVWGLKKIMGMKNAPLIYGPSDPEIQANLFVLLGHGTRERWGRVPLSKYELWAALKDCGIKMPRAIKHELNAAIQKNPEIAQRFLRQNAFQKAAGHATSKISRYMLRAYYARLTRISKELFWREEIPYLCGHLYELMRHPEGRAIMGCAEFDFTREPQRTGLVPGIRRLLGLER